MWQDFVTEVVKVIRAKKHARSKRNQSDSDQNTEANLEKGVTNSEHEARASSMSKNNQVILILELIHFCKIANQSI